jgi:hypothetical protein
MENALPDKKLTFKFEHLCKQLRSRNAVRTRVAKVIAGFYRPNAVATNGEL